MTTLIDRARDVVRRCPDDVALVMIDHDGERRLTYREFFRRAAAYAHALEVLGLKSGDLVVLVQEHDEALLCGFWGALLLNAVPSIFPFLSDKLDPARYFDSVRQLVARSGAAAVLTTERFRAALEAALAGLDVRIATPGDLPDVEPERYFENHAALESSMAFLQHSSGSTGLQKGVMLSHGAVIRQMDAYSRAIRLAPDDVVVSWLPLYHDMGLIAGFVMPLAQGVRLVLMSPFQWVREPQILLRAIHRHRGTLCWQPNFAYNFLATRIRDSAIEGLDLSSWRAAINCSEPVVAASHETFLERFQPYGFRAEALATCYAMAENTFAVTQSDVGTPPNVDTVDADALMSARRAVPAAEGARAARVVSCGPPISACELRVVGEDGETLPDRSIGEIAVRSDSMLAGYHGQPELSAAALRDGWYHSGDMGYLADGELYVTGRKKDLMIVGGKNIYPQDVETLLNEVEGVVPGRTAAFGVFNDRLGTEDVAVVAEVTTGDGDAQADIARAIRSRVAQTLDVTVRYVHLTEARWLVKTSSGKVARAANRDKFMREVLKEE